MFSKHRCFKFSEDCDCPIVFEPVGCYKDTSRPLNDYILSDTDISTSVYSGINVDWKNFSVYIGDFACRCAQKAAEKGYDTFGLQNYGMVFFLFFLIDLYIT